MKYLLVTGGRDYSDREFVFKTLDSARRLIGGCDVLIHGGARGADSIAGDWAKRHGIKEIVFKANWGKYGRGAGPRRNLEMIRFAETLGVGRICPFPGGRGTANMVEIAKSSKHMFFFRLPQIEAAGSQSDQLQCDSPESSSAHDKKTQD